MSNNPLRAYFRKPEIYFKLPSEGKFYPPGVVNIPPNGELAVYPMSTLDEMTIRNPDGLFNGDSTIRVIKNCIPEIKDPWQLNDVDMEAVIIAIRAASNDGKIEITVTCPSCTEETKFDLDLLRMLAEKKNVDYETPLIIGDLSFYFRPLTYAESNKNSMTQFEIEREVSLVYDIEDDEQKRTAMSAGITKLNAMMLDIISQTIASVKTPETSVTETEYIREFLTECDAKTHKMIKDYSVEMKQKNATPPLKITCPHCQHKFEQNLILNFTDFFE